MILPPPPCAIICLAASCIPIRTPRPLMPMMRAQSSSVASRNWPALLMPALLNMTSSLPKARTAAAIIALTLARSITFTCRAIALPPSLPMAAATRSAAARSMSATATRAPWAARSRAIPSPMPRPPPVTMIDFPSTKPVISFLHIHASCRRARRRRPARVHRGDELVLGQRLAVELLGERAIDKDDDPISDRGDLAGVARIKQDHPSRLRQPAHDAVHLPLGADVDAARRIVEHEQRRRRFDPFGKHRLLLIAAGQRADRHVHRARDHAKLAAAIERNLPQAFRLQHKAVAPERQRAHT